MDPLYLGALVAVMGVLAYLVAVTFFP